MSDSYAIVGRIRKPHGIRGELVVQAICDEPGAIFAPGRRIFAGDSPDVPNVGSARELQVIRSRPFKDGWLLGLSGIRDRSEAELWRERYLFAPVDELQEPAEGEVWLHEMVGMRVDHVDGTTVGEIREVQHVPQGLLIDVTTPRGTVSIPYVDAIVVRVDRAGRTITIDPPDGLMDL